MYFDRNNFIVQKDQDGGDTLRVEGSYACALRWRERLKISNEEYFKTTYQQYKRTLDLLQVEPGVFIRHPFDGVEWHKDPKETSRDQLTPTVIAMGLTQLREDLWQYTKRFARRGFLKFQNKDLAGPQDWASLVRAFWDVDGRSTASYVMLLCLLPVVLLGDLQLLLSVLVRCLKARNPDDVGDDWNLLALVLQAQYSLPTPISFIARKLYKWFRPKSFGSGMATTEDRRDIPYDQPIYDALRWYVRPESGGNPEVAWVYRELIQDM